MTTRPRAPGFAIISSIASLSTCVSITFDFWSCCIITIEIALLTRIHSFSQRPTLSATRAFLVYIHHFPTALRLGLDSAACRLPTTSFIVRQVHAYLTKPLAGLQSPWTRATSPSRSPPSSASCTACSTRLVCRAMRGIRAKLRYGTLITRTAAVANMLIALLCAIGDAAQPAAPGDQRET
jgi:hypothetical protein